MDKTHMVQLVQDIITLELSTTIPTSCARNLFGDEN